MLLEKDLIKRSYALKIISITKLQNSNYDRQSFFIDIELLIFAYFN